MIWHAAQVCVHLRRRIPLLRPFLRAGAVDRTGAGGPGRPRLLSVSTLSSAPARSPSRAPGDDEEWDMDLDWALFCGRAAAAASGDAGRRVESDGGGGGDTTYAKSEIPSRKESLMSSSSCIIFISCW